MQLTANKAIRTISLANFIVIVKLYGMLAACLDSNSLISSRCVFLNTYIFRHKRVNAEVSTNE